MREELKTRARYVVVKVGSQQLTGPDYRPAREVISNIVNQVVALHKNGNRVVLVSSGAIASGMGELGLKKRPTSLAEIQACAAIGQSRLMAVYDELFRAHGLLTAQILLTHDDFKHRKRYLNARNTLQALLYRDVIPIINENDTVSVEEIKVGDNDMLSALVADIIPAHLLIILTSADGLYENFGTPEARLLSVIEKIDARVKNLAKGTNTEIATGGMITKINAAQVVTKAGIPLVIANGQRPQVLVDILSGEDVGTMFLPSLKKLNSRKRWIAFHHKPAGFIIINNNARIVLETEGRSLLPVGIVRIEGTFVEGDVVGIKDETGDEFARGLVQSTSEELEKMIGQKGNRNVIHRDDLALI